MIVLHAADLHLDSPLRGLARDPSAPAERLRGASRRAFSRLVDLCLAEQARFLLLVGDLFDGHWRDHHSGLFLARELRRLRDAEVEVVAVRGNHDAAHPLFEHLASSELATVLSSDAAVTIRREDVGVSFHGQSYPRRDVRDNLARHYPPACTGLCNVGLLHTALDGRDGHEPYAPCHLDDLRAAGYDYWALGHVHRREVVAREPWVVFPGIPQGRQARESGPKGCVRVRIEDTAVTDVRWCDLDEIRFEEVALDAGPLGDPDAVLAELRRRVRERLEQMDDWRSLALRVRVHGPSPAHAALQEDRDRFTEGMRIALTDLAGERIWLERVVLETAPRHRNEDPIARELGQRLLAATGDPDLGERWQAELELLRRRLPPELFAQVRAETAGIGPWLSDMEGWLGGRLLGGGGGR